MISELLDDVKSLRPKDQQIEPQPITLDEAQEATLNENPWDHDYLQGKTVGIIGGIRAGSAAETDMCKIITPDGRKQDVDFHALLSRSDLIVVLTRFISHSSMWEAKAYAVEHNKQIVLESAINIQGILMNCVQFIQKETFYK